MKWFSFGKGFGVRVWFRACARRWEKVGKGKEEMVLALLYRVSVKGLVYALF